MLLYEKKQEELRKIFGTFANVPKVEDKEVIYRDQSGDIVSITPNDKYVDNKKGGIKRLSDNKEVNVYIGDQNIVPGDFFIPVVHSTPVKKHDYLYEIEYSKYDIKYAMQHYEQIYPKGACSSVRSGNFVGRNLDWNYDEKVSFMVRIPAIEGKHASIGVADCVNELTKANVESGRELDAYNYLPFATVDGINDAGVYVNTNIVLLDYGIACDVNPGKPKVCTIAIPRLILDNANSAKDALNIFSQYNFFGTSHIGEDPHYMICDATATYIVEFVNNKVHIMSDQNDEYDDIPNKETPIMTNFYMTNWNGETKLPAYGNTIEEIKATGLSEHSMGVERYKLLKEAYKSCTSVNDMKDIMDLVKYTQFYEGINLSNLNDPATWRTEAVGGNLTIYTSVDDWKPTLIKSREEYEYRTRTSGDGWQTTHCSIYNFVDRTLTLRVQEEDTEYNYSL